MPTTYVNIASTTLGSTQSTVTFSGIPNTYTDLVLKWCARSAHTTNYDVVCIQMNGINTNNNYNWAQISGLGTTTGSNGGVGTNLMQSVSVAAGAAVANGFGYGEAYIPGYNINDKKNIIMYGSPASTSTSLFYHDTSAGNIVFTSAITSITLSLPIFGGPGFAAGSTFYLYGIKNS